MKEASVKQALPLLQGNFRIRKYRNVRSVSVGKQGIVVDGDLVETIHRCNTFTLVGKQLALKLLAKKIGITGLEYIAIGTGAAGGTVALDTEVGRSPIIFTSTISGSDKYIIHSCYFEPDTPGSTYTISEIGIFGDGATGVVDTGVMLAANVIAPTVQKEVGIDSLVVDYTLSFA